MYSSVSYLFNHRIQRSNHHFQAAKQGRDAGATPTVEDNRFNGLQTQLETLESAPRVADSARLAADMEAEHTKVAELKAVHLSPQLVLASDEI